MSFRTLTLFVVLLLSTATASAQAPVADRDEAPQLELHSGKKFGYAFLTSTLSLGASVTLFIADQPAAGLAGLVATPFITAGAVQIVGRRHGGHGRFRAPLVGATLGLLGGAGAGALIGTVALSGGVPIAGLFLASVSVPLGSALGAVLAHNESERQQTPRARLSFGVVPTQGGVASVLQGRF